MPSPASIPRAPLPRAWGILGAPTMVTPTIVAASLQTLLGASLELPRAHDARGWGVMTLLAGLFAALALTRRASLGTRARASASLCVVFSFAPALLFPSITPLLLSGVTFLFHWLAGTAGRSGDTAASRLDLVIDLGFLPTTPRPEGTSGAPRDAVTPASPSLEAPLGVLALALAGPLVLADITFSGAVPGMRTGVFLLASIAAWEQAFRRFATVPSSTAPSLAASLTSSTSLAPPSPASSFLASSSPSAPSAPSARSR